MYNNVNIGSMPPPQMAWYLTHAGLSARDVARRMHVAVPQVFSFLEEYAQLAERLEKDEAFRLSRDRGENSRLAHETRAQVQGHDWATQHMKRPPKKAAIPKALKPDPPPAFGEWVAGKTGCQDVAADLGVAFPVFHEALLAHAREKKPASSNAFGTWAFGRSSSTAMALALGVPLHEFAAALKKYCRREG